MSLCPFNVKMLLIGMLQSGRSDTGDTAGEIVNICPPFAQQNVGLSHRQESSDCNVFPHLLISLQTESSAIKGKN